MKSEIGLSVPAARRLYDRLGRLYDLAALFESRAKRRALNALAVTPGERALEIGPGTGRDLLRLRSRLEPQGLAVGADLSFTMARLSKQRSGAPTVQATAQNLPFAPQSIDAVFMAYVLDLIPAAHHGPILDRLKGLLRPGGQIVIVAMTEGVDPVSRALVAAWKWLYRRNPSLCAGCRPLQTETGLHEAGFEQVTRQVIVQLAVPSEIVSARAPH